MSICYLMVIVFRHLRLFQLHEVGFTIAIYKYKIKCYHSCNPAEYVLHFYANNPD